jgi:hypothetical protein
MSWADQSKESFDLSVMSSQVLAALPTSQKLTDIIAALLRAGEKGKFNFTICKNPDLAKIKPEHLEKLLSDAKKFLESEEGQELVPFLYKKFGKKATPAQESPDVLKLKLQLLEAELKLVKSNASKKEKKPSFEKKEKETPEERLEKRLGMCGDDEEKKTLAHKLSEAEVAMAKYQSENCEKLLLPSEKDEKGKPINLSQEKLWAKKLSDGVWAARNAFEDALKK